MGRLRHSRRSALYLAPRAVRHVQVHLRRHQSFFSFGHTEPMLIDLLPDSTMPGAVRGALLQFERERSLPESCHFHNSILLAKDVQASLSYSFAIPMSKPC